MTDKELLYIQTIAAEGSISAASRKLFLAQPSLSQALRRVEEELGAALFSRSASGLVPTEAGQRYLLCARQIRRSYDEMRQELSDMSGLKAGRVNLGITRHLGLTLLPRLLPEFSRRYPGIELRVTEEDTRALEALLLSGGIDFAILHRLEGHEVPRLSYELLSHEPFVLILSPEDEACRNAEPQKEDPPLLDLRHIAGRPFLMLRREQGIRRVADVILARAGITPHIRLTLRGFETAEALAAAGLGVTLLPRDYVSLYRPPRKPAIFAIDPALDPGWSLCIAVPEGGFLSHADEALLSMLRDLFPPSV